MKKQSKKLLSVILSIVLVIGLMPATLFANAENGESPISGAGAAYENWEDVAMIATVGVDYTVDADTDVAEINTAAGLAWFAYDVNGGNGYYGKTVTLKNSIDLAAANLVIGYAGDGENNMADTVTADNSWTAIGNNIFNGTFDGNNNTISGIYINKPSDKNQGLFADIAGYAVVKNVGVINSHIMGENATGAVVGLSYGLIDNCYSTATVVGEFFVGGIVGDHYGNITNSYNEGAVTGIESVGGITGFVNNSYNKVVNNYNKGIITGGDEIGGIVGRSYGVIVNNYNIGAVSIKNASGDDYVGGIIGENSDAYVQNNYYLDNTAQGIGDETEADIATVKMTADDMKDSTKLLSYLNERVIGENSIEYKTWKQGMDLYPVFDTYHTVIDNFWIDLAKTAQANTDYAWSGDTLTINTVKGLAWFSASVNGDLENTAADDYTGKTVILQNSLDLTTAGINGYGGNGNQMASTVLSANSFIPIGYYDSESDTDYPFNGTFDGNNNTISGIYINTPEVYNIGLFAIAGVDSHIKNLGIINSGIRGKGDIGAIAGENYGVISNCYNTGTITGGGDEIGGISGKNSGVISDSYNKGNVTGDDKIGGIAGDNYEGYGVVLSSYNEGNVTGDEEVGGIVGNSSNDSSISDSYNKGTVTGDEEVGGISGDFMDDSQITNCHNEGIVKGDDEVGGIVGHLASFSSKVLNSYNVGDVTGNDEIGGIAGLSDGTVENCYNEGDITGVNDGSNESDKVGGIVGSLDASSVKVLNSYNIGAVTGNVDVGGIVGQSDGIVENCYNEGDVTGVSTDDDESSSVGGILGKNYYSYSKLIDSYNIGNVTGVNDVGGVVGNNRSSGSTIQNSYNQGDVSGEDRVGGVVGDNYGIAQNTYSTGKVSLTNGSTSELIGGIIGSFGDSDGGITEGNYYIEDASNPTLVGIGTKTEDDNKTLKMTEEKMKDGTLLTALNAWVDAQAETYSKWSQLNATSFPILSDIPVSYTITVTGGKTVPTRATAGETVTLTANAPEYGMEFDVWAGLDGITLVEGTLTDEVIKIEMPARNVIAETTYKEMPADKMLEEALKELDGITTENAAANKDKINEVVNDLSDYIEQNKETIKNNPNALSDLEELEDLYVAANGNITVTEKAPVINADVALGDKVPNESVVFSGLALAVFGDMIPESKVELFMSVTQLKSTSEGYFVFDIKPQMTSNGVTSDVTNDMIKGPVTLKLYLNDSVIVGETAKIKHVFNGMNENGVEGTDYEMLSSKVMEDANGKFIVITVTQFSMFTVNVPTALEPTPTTAPTATTEPTPTTAPTATTEPTPTTAPTATTSPVAPQTGDDNTVLFVFGAMMLTAILAVAFVIYKKRKLKD